MSFWRRDLGKDQGWTIAICTENQPYFEDRFKNRDLCSKYPGALWMPAFADLAKESAWQVHSGDVVLEEIRHSNLRPEHVICVSEQHPGQAVQLQQLGARLGVSFCAESPLFIPEFYDCLPEVERLYSDLILFGPDSIGTAEVADRHRMYFPCYEPGDVRASKSWGEREPLSVVAGMKLFLPERSVRFKDGWKALAMAARAKWRQSFSPTMTEVHAHELQTRRFEVVLEFLKEDLIQIFGRGWNQTDKLPTVWRDRFEPYRERLAEAEACADKIEAISAFRFNLCFENVEYPGYVTEKIIDCFVGGTIPVYWGAPDADEIIPRAAYIDGREYSGDWAALRNRLQSMGEGEATGMIEAGRRFLREPGGLCFSHEAFAAKVSGLLRKRIGEGAPA